MTDTTATPTTTVATTTVAPTTTAAAPDTTLHTTIAALQADNAALARQAADATRERDAATARIATLEPKATLADQLQLKVTGFENEKKESALVQLLQVKLPGAEPLQIRGVLGELATAKKADRYPTDPAAEATKIFDLIKTEAPSLLRPPTGAGGSSLVPRTTPAQAPAKTDLVG